MAAGVGVEARRVEARRLEAPGLDDGRNALQQVGATVLARVLAFGATPPPRTVLGSDMGEQAMSNKCPKCGADAEMDPRCHLWVCGTYLNGVGKFVVSKNCLIRQLAQAQAENVRLRQEACCARDERDTHRDWIQTLDEENVRLEADNKRLREVIQRHEWIRHPETTCEFCPSCFAEVQDWEVRMRTLREHKVGCELAAALQVKETDDGKIS